MVKGQEVGWQVLGRPEAVLASHVITLEEEDLEAPGVGHGGGSCRSRQPHRLSRPTPSLPVSPAQPTTGHVKCFKQRR